MTGRWSLKTRFTLLVVALVSGSILLLSGLVYSVSSEYIRNSIGESMVERSDHLAAQLDQDMAARVQEILLLTSLYQTNNQLSDDEIRAQLEQIQAQHSVASWIGLLNSEGIVRVATGGILEGVNIAHRPVFQSGSQQLWLGDVHDAILLSKLLPNPSGEPIKFVDVAAPLRGENGALEGVLAMHLSWEWAVKVMQSMFESNHTKAYPLEYFVLSESHTILLGPKASIGTPISRLVDLEHASQEDNGGWNIRQWSDGRYLTAMSKTKGYAEYAGLGWDVVVRVPEQNAFAPVNLLQVKIAILGVIMLLIFAGTGWFFTARFSDPLVRLARAADKIKTLQDETTIPEEHASLEIEGLSRSLNELLLRLKSQREEIDDLEDIVHTDPLTGLPNRAFLKEYLQHLTPEAKRNNLAIGLLYIDLDSFKEVNDTLGHHAGDILLQTVSKRLTDVIRGEDIVARIGGDEFVMVVKSSRADIESLLADLGSRAVKQISGATDVGEDQDVQIGGSVGAAWWPHHSRDINTVAKYADEALYQAKRNGKGQFQLYHSTSEE
ncbi:diguanylate cyclase domain-containing protein [Alteromonas gilva]|uniref:Diguanylate cyclase n=1 Tax=Alteromonas gilva TaxID=2987522 RepID=A0ABT5KX37_9ALTE|nr:diguanylate cyclase [Alteromonas gilva]MDC8829332.1 diguanylate cyclase [Alteromonas gilva]